MYRTNLGAPPSPRGVETGLGKEAVATTNGSGGDGGGGGGRRSGGVAARGNGVLADTVQEAEDLEALLMGGSGGAGMNGGGANHAGTISPA